MTFETVDQWKLRTKLQPTTGPTKKAKGLNQTHTKTNAHMGTKKTTHVWWDEDQNPKTVIRKPAR